MVEIENIEEMRRRAGIDDPELRQAIRGLKVGDAVKITLLSRTGASETVSVRITRIQGTAFRGKLTGSPSSTGLASLHAGSAIAFTTVHIHSLAKKVAAV